jgi:hypothetical protein
MARKQQDNAPALPAQPAYTVVKREKDRWWEVRDPQDELVCVTVSKRGAVEGCVGSQRDAGQSTTAAVAKARHGCCGVVCP